MESIAGDRAEGNNAEMKTIRVWVVEDHAGYRADLIRTLGRCGVDCVNELETAIGLEEDLAAKPLPDAVFR